MSQIVDGPLLAERLRRAALTAVRAPHLGSGDGTLGGRLQPHARRRGRIRTRRRVGKSRGSDYYADVIIEPPYLRTPPFWEAGSKLSALR